MRYYCLSMRIVGTKTKADKKYQVLMKMWSNWNSHLLMNIHWCNHFRKVFGSICQAECMYILSLTSSIPRPILNRNAYIHLLKDIYKSMHSGCINNSTPPTKHPSVIQWVNNLCCIQSMKITNYCYVQIMYESYKANVKRK